MPNDTERRQMIVQRHKHTKRDPHGVVLDLRLSLNSKGQMFIRARGAKDLSASSDDIGLNELAILVGMLRREQLKRAAA